MVSVSSLLTAPTMQFLIVLALAAAAYAQTYPVDTPEVAAAKAAHFAEVQRAAVRVGAPAWYPYLGLRSAGGSVAITPDGFVADTPEVAAAKEAHFAEKARASAIATNSVDDAPVAYYNPYAYYPQVYSAHVVAPASRWNGPLALPVVTPQGYLADTPEVVAARAAHLAEVARAEAQA